MISGRMGCELAVLAVVCNLMISLSPAEEELFARNVKDVFFDYDKYVIRPDDAPKVQNNAAFLAQHPSVKVLVVGQCEDRRPTTDRRSAE
jgi:outer membrane protein OmpA-like peptidoglycan-associated protein